MEQIRPTLADFEQLGQALKDGQDLGNALQDGLADALAMDLDATDLERALLYLETRDLLPIIVKWRRRFIEAALEEIRARENLGLETIQVTPKIMELSDEDS
jgi:hypothetical protein